MDIRAIVENIPNMIASLYESIYVINKNDNKFYDIKYTGEELRISSPLDYDKINDVMRTYKEFSPAFLNENEFKKVLVTNDNKEKLVIDLHNIPIRINHKLIHILRLLKLPLSFQYIYLLYLFVQQINF